MKCGICKDGRIVIRPDRGSEHAGCNQCYRCVSLTELIPEIEDLREQVQELKPYRRESRD